MLEYKGISWYRYHGTLLPRVEPHESVSLSETEQSELLKLSKAYFIRWCDEWDRGDGTFWYVIKDQKEDLSAYKSKVRNQIKKGLRNCDVKRVENSSVAKEGYRVYANAFKKYDTFITPLAQEAFAQSVLESDDEFWAVFDHENRMIAYANNIIKKDVCYYSSMKFDPDFLRLYPSYALIHTMNEHYLNDRGFRYVSDGSRSISHQTNIQDFLMTKFLFRKAFCKLHIAYRYDVNIAVHLLFPFRRFFYHQDSSFSQKIATLLKHEEIRRSYE